MFNALNWNEGGRGSICLEGIGEGKVRSVLLNVLN